ncbi:MAG: DUF1524 domain-containing protein [Nocardiaceae bacterium]|nr:DUF1524 domain-containing protein [Nocardiaceae bacterium]
MAPPVRVSTLVGVASALMFGGSIVAMPDQEPRAVAAHDAPMTTEPSTTLTPMHYPAITWELPGDQSASGANSSGSGSTGAQDSSADIPAGASAGERAAYAALAGLAIKGRAPKSGYDRDLFGQEWSDDVSVEAGHNGCDTRNDILRRDLSDVAIKRGSNGCAVLTGTLYDPYTGGTINFERGAGSSAVQIDHVVSLSDAWQKGAQQWDSAKRQNFANDPRNLLAVDGPTNQSKGDGDAATWLPPNKSFRCTMVTMQIQVKSDYGLSVTQAEHDAMKRVLDECDGTQMPGPVPGLMSEPAPTTTTVVAPPPTTTTDAPAPPVQLGNSTFAFYKNCAAAKAAGAAPLHRGDPGYRTALDRDGDGVACE